MYGTRRVVLWHAVYKVKYSIFKPHLSFNMPVKEYRYITNYQGFHLLKIFTCSTNRILQFFNLLFIRIKKKCPNPLARLVVFLPLGRRPVGNDEPWLCNHDIIPTIFEWPHSLIYRMYFYPCLNEIHNYMKNDSQNRFQIFACPNAVIENHETHLHKRFRVFSC